MGFFLTQGLIIADTACMIRQFKYENVVFALLIALAVLSRLISHNWNFTAVAAASFVFAFLFPKSKIKTLALPLVALLISDIFIGFYSSMLFNYLAFGLALIPFFMLSQTKNKNFAMKSATVLTGSLIFFMASNFSVWLVDGLYPMTLDGLMTCYVMALPFFKNQLAADLLLTPVLFAGIQKSKFLFSLDHNQPKSAKI